MTSSRQIALAAVVAAVAALLAGCGGDAEHQAAVPPQQPPVAVTPPTTSPHPPDAPSAPPTPVTQLVELSSSVQGMESIAFHNGAAFVSLANSSKDGTSVLKAGLPLANASWAPLNLGKCAIGKTGASSPATRAPTLKAVNGSLWMLQHSDANDEHSLCEIDDQSASFAPRDSGLLDCNPFFCATMSPTDIKLADNRLMLNAGGGENVQVSEDRGATWRALTGALTSQACYEAKFEVIGDRLLVGGECPLDSAYLRAYQLTPATLQLLSPQPLPVALPDLENRNIQFIEHVPNTNRVFVGVEGGLMRSEDGGKSFTYVIHQPLGQPEIVPVRVAEEAAQYPYIWRFLSPANQPDVIVVAGFDKPNTRPYLAWSADGGQTWTDLSSKLPGFSARTGGQVTALVEGPQGQLLLTVNEEPDAKGHLMQLTLGKP